MLTQIYKWKMILVFDTIDTEFNGSLNTQDIIVVLPERKHGFGLKHVSFFLDVVLNHPLSKWQMCVCTVSLFFTAFVWSCPAGTWALSSFFTNLCYISQFSVGEGLLVKWKLDPNSTRALPYETLELKYLRVRPLHLFYNDVTWQV